MKTCMCILAGTESCKYCRNSYTISMTEWKKEMNEKYSDKRKIVKKFFTTKSSVH